MKKGTRVLYYAVLMLIIFSSMLVNSCDSNTSNRIKIVTSNSFLTYITQQVGGNNVEVLNLIPPAQHPGDFNIKPGDIENVAKAKLLILLGSPGELWADKLISSASNPNLAVAKVNVISVNLIPSLQLKTTDKIAAILGQIDISNNTTYFKSAEDYKNRISAKEGDIKIRLTKVNASQVNVIASSRQADFLKWAGLNVIASYGQPETLTPQIVKELVDKGKAGKVTLIVDNLQDGRDAGKGIAQELGAKQINLSNFPGGFDNTETWEKAITYNIDLLINAVSK